MDNFFNGKFFAGGFFSGIIVATEQLLIKIRTFTDRRRF